VCPAFGASISKEGKTSGGPRVEVDAAYCTACGACIDICDHNAREYKDDTEKFFEDLKNGEKISLLIDPSFAANYPTEHALVLGGLKELGARHIINTAFGADIAGWAYINLINMFGFKGEISQSCPVIVSYIEKFAPQLIPKLFPVQSPLICAAIYARKILDIKDKFAYISPCMASSLEIKDKNTGGMVSYNVTFSKLMEYVRKNNISGRPETDEVFYGLGVIWSRPGGLREMIRYYLGEDIMSRQISGQQEVYSYLKKNIKDLSDGRTAITLIDALNCKNGCLCGTGTEPYKASSDDALTFIMERENSFKKKLPYEKKDSQDERLRELNIKFSNLNPNDFLRTYTDRSKETALKPVPSPEANRIFLDMNKDTPAKRSFNCRACGYDTCYKMVEAIYNGFNHKENCVNYMKDLLIKEQEHASYLAEYDEQLGVLNRRTIDSLLSSSFTVKDKFCVVIADLNSLKGINSTYGMQVGDSLLKNVADGFKELHEKYGWRIGRYGGDEFLVILPDINITADSEEMKLIISVLEKPVDFSGEKISMTAGVGFSNSDGVTFPADHIPAAENAMLMAKRSGLNKPVEYSGEQKEEIRKENEIRDKVWEALTNDGFFMVYQPKVDALTKEVDGYEALVRMKTPGVYPGQFIPIAEKNGWIWRIGRITTELTIKQLAKWRYEGYKISPVSVNFSSSQLSDEGYVDFVRECLEENGIEPQMFEIEITEGLFMEKSNHTKELFDGFKKLGIRLLMDDFGSGYSSLGYLTYMPVDVVKVDKSLVDNYLVEGKDSFIKNLITLMHDLDKKTVMEGVEEEWQYERLRSFGADTIQGYYFSKPLPPEEAIEFKVK